jgi:hypothetical protein
VHDDNKSNSGQIGQVIGMGGNGKHKILSCVSQCVSFMDKVGGITATLEAIQKSLKKTNASDVEVTMVVCVIIVKIKMGLCI